MKPIVESIKEAVSEVEIMAMLNYGNSLRPTGRLRRRWLAAARLRRAEINENTLSKLMGPEYCRKIEQAAKMAAGKNKGHWVDVIQPKEKSLDYKDIEAISNVLHSERHPDVR